MPPKTTRSEPRLTLVSGHPGLSSIRASSPVTRYAIRPVDAATKLRQIGGHSR
jgi:hypothetical protein